MESGQQGQDFQRDYFETLINKYECRNAQFAQKQCDLRERLQAIECSLPALMSLNITQPNTFQQPFTTEYDDSPVKEVTSRSNKEHRKCNCNCYPLNPDSAISRNIPNPAAPNLNIRNDMNLHNCTCNPRPISTDLGRSNNFGTTIGQNIKAYGINTENDIRYMAKIKELAENEKKLKNEIKELEDKEDTYKKTAKQPDDHLARDISYNGEGDAEIEAIKQKNQNLEERNKVLEDELEDVRKEIKQIKETVEEPMRRELENERCRCIDIEEQIQKRNADVSSRESAQRKKVEFLQKQLQCANQNLFDLHVVNKRLKEELCMLNCRSNELQTDLINQKISEVHIISRVIASQNLEPTPPPPKPVLSISGSGDNDKGRRGGGNEELNKIARNLSKLIDEANSCNNCKNAHPDLIDTVRYIKNLVDIVNDGTDVEEIPKSDSDVFCKCVDWKKIREEMGLEEPPAVPEITLSEPDVSKLPEATKPPITIKPPEVTEPSGTVVPPEVEEPSEITDKRTSAMEAADQITDVILDDVISMTVIVDSKDKLEKIEEDTPTRRFEEGDTETTTDLQTEREETTVTDTGDITDVSKTEPTADMTEDESEAITTDVDEAGEPVGDKPIDEEIVPPEQSEKSLEEGEIPSEIREKIEAPTEGEGSIKEDIKTEEDGIPSDQPPKLVEEEGETSVKSVDGEEIVVEVYVKPVDEKEAVVEESAKPEGVDEITAEESLKPVDEEEKQAGGSVKSVDGEESVKPEAVGEIAAEESVKPEAVSEIAAEGSVKLEAVGEIVAEESVKPEGEEEKEAEESIKPVDGEEIAIEESVKPIDAEEETKESGEPLDGGEIAVEETVEPVAGEEAVAEEPVIPDTEQETTEEAIIPTEGGESIPTEGEIIPITPAGEGESELGGPTEPKEEGEITTEELQTEGREAILGEQAELAEIGDIIQGEKSDIKEILSEQDIGKPEPEAAEPSTDKEEETLGQDLPEEETELEIEPTKEPEDLIEDVIDDAHKVPSEPVEPEKVEDKEKVTEEIPVGEMEESEVHDLAEGDKEIIELEKEGMKSEKEIEEEKLPESKKPISSDKELVEEIVRTICRCIRRDKPALCDCPVGDTKGSKKDSALSKEDVIQKILSDVVSEIYASDIGIKDTKESKPASKEPSKKSLEQVEQDKPPVSPKASKSLSKGGSEKSLPKDDAESKKSQISTKGYETSKQPSEKSVGENKDDIPAEAEKTETSPEVSSPVSKEPSKKSIGDKEEAKVSPKTSELHSKEPSKTSVEKLGKTEVSPKPSKLHSEKTSKISIDQNEEEKKETGVSQKPSKLHSKEPSIASIKEQKKTEISPKPSALHSEKSSKRAIGPEASPKSSKIASKEPSKRSLEETQVTETVTISKSPSKEPSKKSLKEEHVEKPVSPKVSKPTTKEPSTISLEEKERKASPKVSKPSSKEPSQKSLPKEIDEQTFGKPSSPKISTTTSKDLPHTGEELAPAIETQEKPSNLFDETADTTPKPVARSKQTSREPSSKSLPSEIGASSRAASKEKTRSDVMVRTGYLTSDVPSKEPSAKLLSKEAITSEKTSKEASTKSLSKGGKSVSKELSIKSPSADIIPASPAEEKTEEKEVFIADVEAEGNVPVDAEVELLSKSSDGVYVTTTVTSTGQVEVTTEGPTGVVETTLKVTESGNLEVVTGVTEFDKDAEDIVREAESDHPAPPEVEVLHAAVYKVEESQEGLDVQGAAKSSDKIGEEVTTEECAKECVEEVRPSTEGALGVIAEEEEEAMEKDKKRIDQLPVGKKYCECPPPIAVCKCRSSKHEEIDEPKEQAIILCQCDETKQRTDYTSQKEGPSADELRHVEEEKDRSVERTAGVEITEEETPEGKEEGEEDAEKEEDEEKTSSEEEEEEDRDEDVEDEDEPEEGAVVIKNTVVVPSIKSVEIVENITAKDACYDEEEDEDYDANSGSTVSEVSMFDDLPPDVMKTLKETSTTTVESAPVKSFVIETTIEYKSSERVSPPQKEERASKSILKTGSSWNDSWRNINTQYSNQATAESREANQERGVIKKRSVEAITVSTSTTGLKFSTCTCDEKIQPSKRAKSETLEREERKPAPDDKQGILTSTAPGNTTVNNLKIIICNRDTCRTYTTDQESIESIPKLPTCDCQKKAQRQLSRVCNTKTCGTFAGREQDRKLQTKESDKLLLENATCTTCDITSCQVIKSGTNYSSMDSLSSEDEPIVCPATCPSVGVQHTPKKLFDERSYEGMQTRTAYFKGTTSRSFPGKICADTFSKSEGVCVPTCASKGIQRDASVKQKTHATNTPKSHKICAVDVCRNSPSEQRTVSTYYSSNAVQNKSCDPLECEKRLSNVKFQDPVSRKWTSDKRKSPSEPQMSIHRTCDLSTCKDATTDYKPPGSPNLKRSSIIKKPRSATQADDAPSLSQTCVCKSKSASKRSPGGSKTSSIKTEDLMTTACTSLTCSRIHSVSGSKPASPTSDKSQITTSCTCTGSKPESPKSDQTQLTTSCTCSRSKPESPGSGQTQTTTSCTCSSRKAESPLSGQTQITTSCTCSRSKPESPVSNVCTSETCSAVRKISGSKPDSPTSGQTQITTSCTCPRSKPESPASKVCTSETCSAVRKISGSKPDSPTSGQTQITTSCTCPRSKPESPASKVCTSETCSAVRKISGSKPDSPTSGQTQITTSCTCPRSKPESPASKVCTSETCSAVRKISGSKPDSPTSGQTQITTSCTCPRSKPESPASKVCTSETCSAIEKIPGRKLDSPISGQIDSSESKPKSPTSDQIKICNSATCAALQTGSKIESSIHDHLSKLESPASDKSVTCTSATCSGLKFYTPATSLHSSIAEKTPSKASQDIGEDTAPCRSDTCSGIISKGSSSHKSGKQSKILSPEETPCRSTTCSNINVPAPSAPASIASEKVVVDKIDTTSPTEPSDKMDTQPEILPQSSSISKKSSSSAQKSVTDQPSLRIGKPDIGDVAEEEQILAPTNKLESSISDEKTEKDEPLVIDDSKLQTPEKKDSSIPQSDLKSTDDGITHPETEGHTEATKENEVIDSSKLDTDKSKSPGKASNIEEKVEVDTTPSLPDKKSKTPSQRSAASISSGKSQDDSDSEMKKRLKNKVEAPRSSEIKVTAYSDDTDRKQKKDDSKITADKIASETVKITKSSVGDIPKSPKSASKYTLTEKVTSVTDYSKTKKSLEKIVSKERDVVSARPEESTKSTPEPHPTTKLPSKSSKISVEKSHEKREENLKSADSKTADEAAVKAEVGGISPKASGHSKSNKEQTGSIRSKESGHSKIFKEKVSKDKAESIKSKESEPTNLAEESSYKENEVGIAFKESESSKVAHTASSSSQSTQQSSRRPSKEISRKSSGASRGSGTVPVETPQGTEGETEITKIESAEKLPTPPTKPGTREESTPSSKESLCLPCRRMQKASGDKISKPPKEPPDKGSKTSVRSTESERKSKIPVAVSKTSSIDKEKHQGDCSCVECLTEEMQKDKHPPDCDCVDCLCLPEKFEPTLPVIDEPEHAKEPESIPHSPSCTCIDCLCEPKGITKKPSTPPPEVVEKPKHSPDCACVDCLCAPIGDVAKKQSISKTGEQRGSTVIAFTCPSLPPAKIKTHHPDCKCPECVCDPCGHRPGCSCALCKCEPCKDEIVEFKKHPPDCTCPDCICAPCGDKKAEEQKKHPPHCNCLECVCDPCNDGEVEKMKQIRKPHPKDCDCPECVCKPCNDEKVEARKLVSQHTQHVEDGSCTCEECVCDPCDDPKVALKKQPCKECGCLVCMCDPCEDPKIVERRKPHPPTCNCPECVCDPCNDPAAIRAHSPDCSCRQCICKPCTPHEKPHGPACDCPECICAPCKDPGKHKSVEKKEDISSAEPHKPDCKCKKCVCKPRKRKKEPEEPPKSKEQTDTIPTVTADDRSPQKSPESMERHGPKCKCSTCKLSKISPPTKNVSRTKTREVDLPGIPEECPECDCSPICVCDDCPAKKNNTAPTAKGMKNEMLMKNIKDIEQENVRREKDINELQALMEQIRCACHDAERQAARTAEPTYIQKASSFKNTLSGLQIAMNTLQEKCVVKDKMIEAMTQELRLRANSNIFHDMLKNITSAPPANVDFDRQEVCGSLPRPINDPKYGRPSYRYPQDVGIYECICEHGSINMQILNIKQISPDSILIKWTPPENNKVIGYEVEVDNVLKSRIHSAQRTSAMIFAVNTKNKMNINVYALTQFGRCQPPATCVYGS